MSIAKTIHSLLPKSNNPFQDILSALNTDTVVITLAYLGTVKDICAKHNVFFSTYGAVFDMLRFLETNKCVTIQETESGEYTMTGLYQYGKHDE